MKYTTSVGRGVPPAIAANFGPRVDRVLADPRGWRQYGIAFERAAPGQDVLLIRLETGEKADAFCGFGERGPSLSCWAPSRAGPGKIVIHLGNWLGRSASALPTERYRNYVINHEVGHALGLRHPQCPIAECKRRGVSPCPAPVMMQMTRGAAAVAPCVESDWPLGPGWPADNPRIAQGGEKKRANTAVFAVAAAVVFVLVLVLCAAAMRGLRSAAGGGRQSAKNDWPTATVHAINVSAKNATDVRPVR